MMHILRNILAVAALAGLVACGSVPIGTPVPVGSPTGKTPAQIAAQVCPPVQGALLSLQGLILTPVVMNDIGIASGVVNTVCAVGSTVNLANLQSIVATVLPALSVAIKASPLSVAQQNALILDLTVAGIVLNGALAVATPVPVTPAVAAAAASAPASAAK